MDWRSFFRVNFLDRPPRGVIYCFIFALLLISTIIRFELSSSLGPYSPFITYIPVIVICAWIAGFEGGFIATVVSTLLAAHYFMPPAVSPAERLVSLSRLEVYLFEGILIALLGHAQFNSRRREAMNAKIAAENAQLANERTMALAKSEERQRLAIDGAQVGTWHMDIAGGMITFSDRMKALIGRPDFQPTVLANSLEAVHPEDLDMVRAAITSSIESHTDFNIEYRIIWPDGTIHWQVARGCCYYDEQGAPVSLEGIGIDITDRKQAEEEANARARSASALNTINKAIRETRDSLDVQKIALSELADVLSVDRCLAILLDERRDMANFVAEWHKPGLSDLAGEYSLADFHVDLHALFSNTTVFIVENIDEDRNFSPVAAEKLKAMNMSSLVNVPMSVDGEIIGVLCVCMADRARLWTTDEVSFVEAVASQLRAATESSRVLTQARNRAAREELINRIGHVMRTSLDPEVIQGNAVSLLGEALGADRCYFALYNLTDGVVTIGRDWHRADLPSVQGVHVFENTKEMFAELYPATSTSIIRDRDDSGLSSQTIENMKGLQLRSRLSVALADTTGMATLTAAMADEPRDWLPEDVELVEKVASLLRSGVEMARVQHREHRIATDLQAALLPTPPKSVPGLKLGGCMQPALDEAEIGGDFVDVFPLDDGLFALVIGDVSGKGLAAAGQLATVRNSLRAYLYINPAPSEAVTTLNSMLTAHELLSGFVTLFVGVYDPSTAALTYSSCGHEPILLRRQSDSSVELLRTPGLPIGVDPGANYAQDSAILNEGDVVLFYTDGLSEAGPSRKETIDTEGLIRFLERMDNFKDVDNCAAAIMNDVKKYANGYFRDDVCILLACRESDA